MEELRPSVSISPSVRWVCVCVCVSGALWAVLVAVRLGGRAMWTPWPAPSQWERQSLDDVGPDGEAAPPGHRAKKHTYSEGPLLCPCPVS